MHGPRAGLPCPGAADHVSPRNRSRRVVSHASGSVVVEREPAQRRHRVAYFAVAEFVREQVEAQDRGKQRALAGRRSGGAGARSPSTHEEVLREQRDVQVPSRRRDSAQDRRVEGNVSRRKRGAMSRAAELLRAASRCGSRPTRHESPPQAGRRTGATGQSSAASDRTAGTARPGPAGPSEAGSRRPACHSTVAMRPPMVDRANGFTDHGVAASVLALLITMTIMTQLTSINQLR